MAEKTEKATPKKRGEAFAKGQVAKSMDLNGAVVLMASLLALSAFGPRMLAEMETAMLTVIQMVSHPEVVDQKGIGSLFMLVGKHVVLGALPVVLVCMVSGFIVNVAQVKLKLKRKAIKPDFKRLNPMQGLKNLFSPNSLVELGKNLIKIGLVGAIVVFTVLPKLDELAAMVGTPAQALLPQLCQMIFTLAQRAALVYLAIGFADLFWQKHRMEKGMKMEKKEVEDEHKQQELPAEVKRAQKRKAFELASARMMDAVPTADVVVVNPTHYSVALKYDADHPAPIVVAKGVDDLALRIRELARDADVAVVPDPPLARTLYATVDVGKMIPEDLFHAVAQLLAYVYRVANASKGEARPRAKRERIAVAA
jgi:flagellar biosynthetic protein FlhB